MFAYIQWSRLFWYFFYQKTHKSGFYRGLQVLVFFSVPKTGSRFGAYQFASNNLFTEKSRVNSLLCGLTAGFTEAVVAVTPMETIKTKLIHDRISGTGKYRGLFHGIQVIAGLEGIGGLYRGLGPTIIKQSSNQGVRFLVFNELQEKFMNGGMTKVPATLLAGAFAGAASVYANTPVDVVKTNMQGEAASQFNGPMDCARQIWANEGLRGFYKGTVPRLTRVVIDVAITFTIYEEIKNQINKVWPN